MNPANSKRVAPVQNYGGPPLGVHVSTTGGLCHAFTEATRLGCDCFQIFVKNQRQWSAKALSLEDSISFRENLASHNFKPVVAHGSYLINLASPLESTRKRSVEALIDELNRCDALGVNSLVVHPGAGLGADEAVALRNVADSVREVEEKRTGRETMLLLEVTAGQGSTIGYRLEHFAEIFESIGDSANRGICLDTCHLFAAGYDFRTEEQYQNLIRQIDATIGHSAVRCIHLNDSKRELGSRVDRHEHIGKGHIGKEGFSHFLNDPRFASIPMILETPKGVDGRGTDFDRINLKRLRSMVRS